MCHKCCITRWYNWINKHLGLQLHSTLQSQLDVFYIHYDVTIICFHQHDRHSIPCWSLSVWATKTFPQNKQTVTRTATPKRLQILVPKEDLIIYIQDDVSEWTLLGTTEFQVFCFHHSDSTPHWNPSRPPGLSQNYCMNKKKISPKGH